MELPHQHCDGLDMYKETVVACYVSPLHLYYAGFSPLLRDGCPFATSRAEDNARASRTPPARIGLARVQSCR
jgi:hypothetical protein